jgi:hypothetical protein
MAPVNVGPSRVGSALRQVSFMAVKTHQTAAHFNSESNTMNAYLRRFVQNRIEEAADFVLGHMPIDLPPQQVYQDLFGGIAGGEILNKFRAAGEHLVPAVFAKRTSVMMKDMMLTFMLRLPPTDVDNVYFMPIEGFFINPESKLAQALKLPLHVAQQWVMLREAFDKLADVTDAKQIAMLMPWLRDMVDTSTAGRIGGQKREVNKINAEVKIIMQGNVPNRFPRLTSQLNQVCLSGKPLFTQYRLLMDTVNETEGTLPPIAVTRNNTMLPSWFNQHLEEVIGDWNATHIR